MSKDRGRLRSAIFSDVKAKKSYDRLLSNGLKSVDRLLEFVAWAAVIAEKKPSRKASKAIAHFPVRLKSIATDVEKLNANPLYTPEKEYISLPDALRGYAEQLQERRRLLQRSRKGRPGEMGQALKSIRWLVRRETGRENCALLKHILVAATPNSVFDFDAALKMNSHRYPLDPQ